MSGEILSFQGLSKFCFNRGVKTTKNDKLTQRFESHLSTVWVRNAGICTLSQGTVKGHTLKKIKSTVKQIKGPLFVCRNGEGVWGCSYVYCRNLGVPFRPLRARL